MRFLYLLTLMVVLMLCLEAIDAKKNRGGKKNGKGKKGGKNKNGKGKRMFMGDWDKDYAKACEVAIGGEVVLSRTCGCETVDDDGCSIRAPDRTYTNGDVEETQTRKFCNDATDSEESEMLQRACYLTDLNDGPIEDYTPYTCPDDQACLSSDVTKAWRGFQKNGVDVLAYFCTKSESPSLEDCSSCEERGLVCGLKSPARLNELGELVQESYCYKEPDTDDTDTEADATDFENKLGYACEVRYTSDATEQTVEPTPCKTGMKCENGDRNAWTGFTYRGDDTAQAFFCTSQCVMLPAERGHGGSSPKSGGGGSSHEGEDDGSDSKPRKHKRKGRKGRKPS